MSDKRAKTIFTERHNQEGMHSRYKNTISVLNDLMKDAALVKHRKTLDEVAKAMTRALENDQKWSLKVKMLQAELDSNESRMKIALELSERDKNAIVSLQNELKTAWSLIEEFKLKNKNDSNDVRQSIVEGKRQNDEEVEQKEAINRRGENRINTYNNDKDNETKRKVIEYEKLIEQMREEQDRLQNEIERMKLQVFELEEELTNKDKCIEELISALNSKSSEFDVLAEENTKLKKTLNEVRTLNSFDSTEDIKKANNTNENSKEQKLKDTIRKLKMMLQDISKKDEISLEKVKHLIKKNSALNKQFQTTKNQNNLMKLELAEQTKMLDLLSCQFCKLEERSKKQTITITELENIRNKYIHMVGNLEQEIHEMRKSKF